jgi:zinc/manganese transport system permease protein
MSDAVQNLTVAFLVAIVLTGIHAYLGIHVLSRNVVFVDLALAQISALGATVAFMLGHLPQSAAAYGYALAFTLAGAVLLSLSRHWSGRITQEAVIGVIYVVAAAAAFLLIDKAPQGAEHIKQLLVGSILTATVDDLIRLAALYAVIAAFHWLFRKRFLLLTLDPARAKAQGLNVSGWDFLFYASFGVVVTSSVAIAGVLLVFSFLIIPAAIGMIYSDRIARKLYIGWTAGVLASAAGLGASYAWDLPTGATMVCAFGVMLALAGLARPLVTARGEERRRAMRRARHLLLNGILISSALSGAWLALNPRADQPLLDALEAAQPAIRDYFLSPTERDIYASAANVESKIRGESSRIGQLERESRWQGSELTDDEVRRLASYVQSFQEMQKGEQFVQREIRNRGRERQRWAIGVPLLLISLGLLLVTLR